MWKMIDIPKFIKFIEENFDLVSGVPCSYFKNFLAGLAIQEEVLAIKHLIATREDEAIAIASGAAISRKRAILYMQNSGIGNIGDALTSLAQLYRLPMLLMISYRGLEDDIDFPEHSIMGDINDALLNTLKLKFWHLEEESWQEIMQEAITAMNAQSVPVVVMVKKGVLSE
jgi:phosphonopyruvate decarboxylase